MKIDFLTTEENNSTKTPVLDINVTLEYLDIISYMTCCILEL